METRWIIVVDVTEPSSEAQEAQRMDKIHGLLLDRSFITNVSIGTDIEGICKELTSKKD